MKLSECTVPSEYLPAGMDVRVCDNCNMIANISRHDKYAQCIHCGEGNFVNMVAVPAPVADAADAVIEAARECAHTMDALMDTMSHSNPKALTALFERLAVYDKLGVTE